MALGKHKIPASIIRDKYSYRKMEVFRPRKATLDEMTRFHSDEYIKCVPYGDFFSECLPKCPVVALHRFLKTVLPENLHERSRSMQQFNVGEDCPVFEGLYEFCQVSSGGTLGELETINVLLG